MIENEQSKNDLPLQKLFTLLTLNFSLGTINIYQKLYHNSSDQLWEYINVCLFEWFYYVLQIEFDFPPVVTCWTMLFAYNTKI